MRHDRHGIRRIDLAEMQLASSETARIINRDIVLELIRASQPISRADLARRSGLGRSTISQIVEQLIGENWVREGAMGSLPRGRRPTMVGLNEDLVAIAVDIHPRQASVALVDLNGRLLSRSLAPLTSDPADSMRLIIDCMQRMQRTAPRKSIKGIGISLPGRVNPATQRLIFAPNLKWPEFDIKKMVETKMGLPVMMENDATACLLAELTFARMDGVRDAVLVAVAEGVGTCVLANGQLVVRPQRNGGRVRPCIRRSQWPALRVREEWMLGSLQFHAGPPCVITGSCGRRVLSSPFRNCSIWPKKAIRLPRRPCTCRPCGLAADCG